MSYQTDIVIVNYNTRRYLRQCLASIRKYSGPFPTYRVWVVDNASTDGSISECRRNRWVNLLINQQNRGYAAACNRGIRAGNGSSIFLCNSDITMTPNWHEPLLQMLSKPEVAMVGPRLVNPAGYLVGVGVTGTNAEPVIRGRGELDEPFRYNQPTECVSLCGACIGIKRDLLPELGLLDEHYFHYFEETDYCFQVRSHGYKVVYCPDSKVIHHTYGSCRDNLVLRDYYQKSQNYFRAKWRDFLQDSTVYA